VTLNGVLVDLFAEDLSFRGRCVSPVATGSVLSPTVLADLQRAYSYVAKSTARHMKMTKGGAPPPEYAGGIFLKVHGAVHIEGGKSVSIFEDNGSAASFRGGCEIHVWEGCPGESFTSHSKEEWVYPSGAHLPEVLRVNLFVDRPKLEFFYQEISRRHSPIMACDFKVRGFCDNVEGQHFVDDMNWFIDQRAPISEFAIRASTPERPHANSASVA